MNFRVTCDRCNLSLSANPSAAVLHTRLGTLFRAVPSEYPSQNFSPALPQLQPRANALRNILNRKSLSVV